MRLRIPPSRLALLLIGSLAAYALWHIGQLAEARGCVEDSRPEDARIPADRPGDDVHHGLAAVVMLVGFSVPTVLVLQGQILHIEVIRIVREVLDGVEPAECDVEHFVQAALVHGQAVENRVGWSN